MPQPIRHVPRHHRFGRYLLSILVLAGLVWGCASLENIGRKPAARYDGVQLSDPGLLESTLNFNFLINNPNPLTLRTGQIRYELKLNGKDFARGQLNQGISLPPSSTVPLKIPFKIRYLDFFSSMAEMIRTDNVGYVMTGTIGMGTLELPLQAGGTIDLPRLPSVTVESLTVRQLSLSGADLMCRLKIENPNAFDIRFNRIFYNLKLDGKTLAHLEAKPRMVIEPNETGTIENPVKISFALTGQSVYDLLQKPEADYRMDAQMVFDSPTGGIESVPFVATGRIPLLR